MNNNASQPMDDVERDRALTIARQYVYRFLSLALSDPLSQRWGGLLDRQFQELAVSAAEILRRAAGKESAESLAHGELPARQLDLASIIEFVNNGREEAAAEHQRVFGLMMSKKCPPYETEYCPQTFSVFRSQQIADIAGFYRAFGLEPSRDMPERADHIATELEFMAWVIAKEQWAGASNDPRASEWSAACRECQQRFLTDHLAWWTPAFARALRRQADSVDQCSDDALDRATPPGTYLGAAASALAAFISIERAILRVPPPRELVQPVHDSDVDSDGCDECPMREMSSLA